jgi:hypothetical protein
MNGRVLLAAVSVVASTGVMFGQTPAPAGTGAVVIRGCVAPLQRDGSLALKAGTAPTPITAIEEANSTEPTGRFQLLDALEAKPGPEAPAAKGTADQRRTSFALFGHETELAKETGHRVEITGAMVPIARASTGPNVPTDVDGIRHIKVGSVKRIAGSCSPAKP